MSLRVINIAATASDFKAAVSYFNTNVTQSLEWRVEGLRVIDASVMPDYRQGQRERCHDCDRRKGIRSYSEPK